MSLLSKDSAYVHRVHRRSRRRDQRSANRAATRRGRSSRSLSVQRSLHGSAWRPHTRGGAAPQIAGGPEPGEQRRLDSFDCCSRAQSPCRDRATFASGGRCVGSDVRICNRRRRAICSHRLACRCDGKTALHKTRSRECTLLLKTAMARPRTVSPTPLSGKTSPSCGHGCEPDDAADEPVNLFDQLVAHVTKLLDGKSAPSQPMHAGRRVAQAQKMSPTSVISGPSGSEENAISGWKLDGGPGLPISEPVRQAAVESAPGEECQAEVAWEAEDTSWRRQRDACAGPCRNTA